MVTEAQWRHNGSDAIARARTRKAEKLAAVLRSHGATAETARALPDAGWAMAEDLAHVRVASVDTRAMVVALLTVDEETDQQVFDRL